MTTPSTPRLALPTEVPPTRYRYLRAATQKPCLPDLSEDPRGHLADAAGWIEARPGGLFAGRTVGWRGLSVHDAGVDIECIWDRLQWLDRLLIDPAVLDQLHRVRILVPVGDRLRQIGQLDLSSRTSDEFELESAGPIGADLGHWVQRCVLRLETRLRDVSLTGGLSFVGWETEPLGIFPANPSREEPGNAPSLPGEHPTGEHLTGGHLAGVTVRPYGDPAARVAGVAVERAVEVLGHRWQIAGTEPPPPGGSQEETGALVLEFAGTAPRPPALGEGLEPDGFTLEVSEDRIVITGDRLGLRYGLESVLQQVILEGRIRIGSWREEPAHRFRGVHLPLPGPSQVDYFRRLIRNLVIPARFNTVIIEVAGGMEFVKHPEINRTWQDAYRRGLAGEIPMPGHFPMVAPGECLPQQVAAELADELRAAGLEVVPEVQSLSHVQYLTLSHPEIAEVPGEVDNTAAVDLFAADQPDAKHPSCYCPENPAAQALIADVMTEILDVFRPDSYVHLGHDEVYELGVCPVCTTKDPAQLFADDLNRLCAIAAERGLQPIIWADMLQPDVQRRAAAAIDQLPADLILMDFIWYFHRERDTEPYLLESGRQVVIGNLYSSHYPRWQERSTRQGILGGQVSTWIALDDEQMAREGKYFDLAMVGVMLWSSGYHRHHRPGLTSRITTLLTDLRARMIDEPRVRAGSGADLLSTAGDRSAGMSDAVAALVSTRADGPVSIPIGYGQSSRHDLGAAVTVSEQFSFVTPDGATQLQLLHALTRPVPRVPWKPLTEIGRYRFTDAAGAELGVLPLTAGGTIGLLTRRPAEPLPTSYYRHQGYTDTYRTDPLHLGQTETGQNLTLHQVTWQIPDDAGPVTVILEVDADVGTEVLLAAATAH